MAPALSIFHRINLNTSTFAASNPTGLKAPHGVVERSTHPGLLLNLLPRCLPPPRPCASFKTPLALPQRDLCSAPLANPCLDMDNIVQSIPIIISWRWILINIAPIIMDLWYCRGWPYDATSHDKHTYTHIHTTCSNSTPCPKRHGQLSIMPHHALQMTKE